MSTAYGLECRTHKVHSEEWLQYGPERFKSCAKIVSLAQAIDEKLKDDPTGITIALDFVGSEPIDFLKDHKSCDVWLISEYSPSITEYDEKLEIE